MCPSTGNCQPRLQLVQNEPGFPTDATTAFHLIAYFAAKESLKREKQTGNQVVEAPSLIWHIFEPTFTPAE